MNLIRLDSNPNPKSDEFSDDHQQTEYGVERVDDYNSETSRLRVNFRRFGRGGQRRSDFAVEVNWIDVKGFVSEFMEVGHPEAVQLRRIIKLAEAIERSGWEPADPVPADFWDDFPPAESK